jgi:hypothetical protein
MPQDRHRKNFFLSMTMVLLDASEDSKLAIGSNVRIRYHPGYPDMWRWLG